MQVNSSHAHGLSLLPSKTSTPAPIQPPVLPLLSRSSQGGVTTRDDASAPTRRQQLSWWQAKNHWRAQNLHRLEGSKKDREKKVGLTLFWGFVQPLIRTWGLLTAGAADPETGEVAAGQQREIPSEGTGILACPLTSHPTIGSRGATNTPRSPHLPLGSHLPWDPPWLSGVDPEHHQTPSPPVWGGDKQDQPLE